VAPYFQLLQAARVGGGKKGKPPKNRRVRGSPRENPNLNRSAPDSGEMAKDTLAPPLGQEGLSRVSQNRRFNLLDAVYPNSVRE